MIAVHVPTPIPTHKNQKHQSSKTTNDSQGMDGAAIMPNCLKNAFVQNLCTW